MRKSVREFLSVPGWTHVSITANLYLPCSVCGKKDKDMFFRYTETQWDAYPQTEVRCQGCVGK